MHTLIPPFQIVRQLAQLAVYVQASASDLSGYEVFFGAENVGYIREGAGKMVRVMGEVLGSADGSMSKDQRHDLRNHVAVVKGFCDLILLDLPEDHSATPQLEQLSGKCTEFVRLLDEHRAATTGMGQRALAS